MAAIRYDRSTTISSRTLAQYPGRIFACSTEKKRLGPEARESYPSEGTKTSRGRNYARSLLPQLAVQSSHGEKTQRWQSQMRRKQLSTPAKGYIVIQKCLLVSRMLRHAPAAGPRTKLYPNRKANSITGFCRQEALEILADFLVEKPDENPPDTSVVETPQEPWTLFTNGSSCVDGSGASLILTSSERMEFTYAVRFQFTAFNNEAEYEALTAGLRIAAQMGVRNVQVSVDSKVVANQILRTYVAKEENIVKYLEKAKSLISGFANFSISQVPRSKNKKADALSKIASTSFAHLSKQVLVEILKEKFIQEEEVVTVVEEEGPTWMTPIMEYLKDGTLSGDRKEASKLRIKARQYKLLEGVLYKRSFLKTWLRHPQQTLTPITALWPFYKWGINIVGPFPEGPGKVKFLIVAMDYFTKWIEAKAVATITGNQVKKFVWDNIVCRFGLPGEIVLDNEAVIPAEIEMPTYHTAVVDAEHNDEELRLNLDLLEKRRERAAIRKAKAKSKMIKHYNARVRGVTFRPGDFVYRSNDASYVVDGGKLGPKWEGPYEVTEALRDGAYRLRAMDGAVLPQTWNIANLKKCYL
ncbi:reverse transcriptase domain-containing protein [Tanacetum coccineum]